MNAPRVVAFGGPSGSGKSSLVALLTRRLGDVATLKQDWFFRDGPEIQITSNFCNDDYIDCAAFDRAARALAGGAPTEVPYVDEATFHVRGTRTLQPAAWVLIEGMTVLRQPVVRELAHDRFYLAPSERTIANRKRHRDETLRGRTLDVIQAQMIWVISEYRFDLRDLEANIVLLDADLPNEEVAKIVLQKLGSRRPWAW